MLRIPDDRLGLQDFFNAAGGHGGRGSIMENMEIIRKAMTICMVYCMKAIRSPTCMLPASTPWAPFHIISTVMPFIISIIIGIMVVMTRLTNRLVRVKSLLALSKRSSSCFWC